MYTYSKVGGFKVYDLLNVQAYENVTVIEINNSPVNSLSRKLAVELFNCFQALEKDPSVHVVVMRGAGEKFFIAGADIKEFPEWLTSTGPGESVSRNHEIINYIEAFPKPTIAFLNGIALGGGLEVAMAFDLRFAEKHVKLGVPEINLGIFPGAGGTLRLPKIIGKARALEMMYTGTPISAEKALQYGLINDMFETGEGFEAVLEKAKELAYKSAHALKTLKQAVLFGEESTFEKSIDKEVELFTSIFKHPDAIEGIHAFIEKRKPNFNQ